MRRIRTLSSLLVMLSGGLLAQHTINGGEYWIDRDFDSRSTITPVSSENLFYQANIDVGSLINGLHTIHYRFMDDRRYWSSVVSEFFIKSETSAGPVIRQVDSYEYWFDSDFNNRVEAAASGDRDFTLIANLDVAGLRDGLHIIHYRFRDSGGIWSSVLSKFFVKEEAAGRPVVREIVSYEQWFDDDFAGRTEQPVSHVSALNLTENLDVSRLNDGLHSVHYRFKDTDHRWSSVLSKYIVCKSGTRVFAGNKIVAYRYWFNGDSITEVALDNPIQNLAFMDTLEMYRYRKGEHYVTLQFKDELGLWSVPLTDTVEKVGFPIARMFSPGEIVCDTATLEFLSQSHDADSLLWSVNGLPVSGDTVLNYFFSETGVYDVGLTARDNESGIDSTILVTVTVDSITAELISGENFAVCEGESIQISAVPGYTYLWSTDENSRSIEASEEQWYIVKATTVNNCSQQDSVYLVVHDNPVVNLGGDQSLPVNGSLQLDAGAGFTSYLWYDNDDKQLKTFSGAILGLGEHEVYVSVVDENICKGSDTITISVTAAVGMEEACDQQIKMYPVPVQEHLTIEIPEAMLGTIVRIYSSSGRILSEQSLENEISIFDMSPYSSGYYMITLINQEQVYTKTVVLSK